MSSFFGRLKSSTTPSAPSSSNSPAKKDPNAPLPTPLEKLLTDAGPLRTDGSDKFFGFENFGSTCYCNSIIQCLYYSAPFREQVLNFPHRSPEDALNRTRSGLPRINTETTTIQNGSALSPTKTKAALSPQSQMSPRVKAQPTSAATGPAGAKPEDNKDSPEYKKKQALAAGPVLTMDYENSRAYGMPESLFTCLKDIFEAIIAHRSRIGVVSPHKFLEVLKKENEMFRPPMHQDAHEFLNLLLNQVVENVEQFSKTSLSTPIDKGTSGQESSLATAMAAVAQSTRAENGSNSRWVHELFEGTLTSETRCLTCENTSQRDEAFLDLSVDLEQHSSVTSCLRKFSEEEMLCERNKFHCDRCGGLQEAEKRMKVKRLPRILALHLKRFKYTEDLQRLQKLFHRVVYPYYLRLFNTTDDAEDPDRLYELYAVVVHIGGGPYHGHYVSIIKTQDKGWLLFDDEMVEPVDKSFVRNYFGGEGSMACAYVLFYQETTDEAMRRELEKEGSAHNARSPESQKEGVLAHGKTNGVAINGPVPLTPTTEEQDLFTNLDHAATVQGPITPHTPFSPPPLEPTTTSPTFPLRNKKSNIQAKKEREKEERERKAAEKELEKQAKQKKKEMEAAKRESQKRQESELQAAIAASKASKAEEDKRAHAGEAAPEPTTTTTTSSGIAASPAAKDTKENGFLQQHGLSRFRPSSMTLRHKPWKLKDKISSASTTSAGHEGAKERDREKEKEKDIPQHQHQPPHQQQHLRDSSTATSSAASHAARSSSASAPVPAPAVQEPELSQPQSLAQHQTKAEKKEKSGFWLGRKKSTALR